LERRGFGEAAETLATQLAPHTLPANGAFKAWEFEFRAMAGIAELAAVGGWAGLEADLQKILEQGMANQWNEIAMLLDLVPYRDGVLAEALAQRSGILAYFQGLAGFTFEGRPNTTRLCALGLAFGGFVVMHYKATFQRRRPSELWPGLMPPVDVPGHAAFPSGHATEAHLIARLLAAVLPQRHPALPLLAPLAHRIAINREVLGLHYRSDSVAGEVLAGRAFGHMMRVAEIKDATKALDRTTEKLDAKSGPTDDADVFKSSDNALIGGLLASARAEWP
jgi:membrane-associated phospholipid phosphatase